MMRHWMSRLKTPGVTRSGNDLSSKGIGELFVVERYLHRRSKNAVFYLRRRHSAPTRCTRAPLVGPHGSGVGWETSASELHFLRFEVLFHETGLVSCCPGSRTPCTHTRRRLRPRINLEQASRSRMVADALALFTKLS